MAKDYSKYQRGVIDRYYDNLDTIMLQKLQELVTELYLEKDGPKEDKLWERVEKALGKLKVKQGIFDHIMRTRRVEVLAKNIEGWLSGNRK